MNIVVQKSDEDLLLADCDNSCSQGRVCACIVDLGMNIAGQGMYDYGFTKCVLCFRKSYTSMTSPPPYKVIPDEYPKEWVVSGSFIRFDKDDYLVVGNRQVIQNTDGYTKYPKTWLSNLYDTKVESVPLSYTNWFLAVCETPKCKKEIHSYIDEHRAVGIEKSYMDLETDTLKCSFCHKALVLLNAENGLLHFKGQDYAECRFCRTIVLYDNDSAIQICTTCNLERLNEQAISKRVCLRCNNSVTSNKKGGSQTVLVKNADGVIEEMFFCRHHRIKNIDANVVYDHEYIKNNT
jgi:ssDNA-binding Zn-finger/Zn-ribbon topoisomerase 1